MAKPKPPTPVKYFVAVLYGNDDFYRKALSELKDLWGNIDFEGAEHLFDVTEYYNPEMGSPLFRRIIAFEKLFLPTLIVDMKIECNRIEDALALNEKRTVNLDPGYLDHNKYLLASAKDAGQKIYLDKGIYADLAGRFKAGKYRPFEWSFPDFRDGRYDDELLAIRKIYMAQLRMLR